MDLKLFQEKYMFPRFVMDKLTSVPIDYKEMNLQIDKSRQEGFAHLKAAVVLLLNFKNMNDKSEYVFQLIKRSDTVSQGGDISCPGGMLQPGRDKFLNFFLKTGILPAMRGRRLKHLQNSDKETESLVHLFLTNALRESWEEIGLNPFNIKFLGALPSYSLTLFARTIFPVVCLTCRPFKYRLSSEVEKILEIPVSFFFNSDNYAMLDIKTALGKDAEPLQYQTPCLIIRDGHGGEDILWGATYNIINNFLRIISDNSLPTPSSSRTLNKILTINYISAKT